MRLRTLLRVATALLAARFALAAAPAPAQLQCAVDGEWLCHKTEDGLHPDGLEQALVWRMNRARQDPPAEGAFLAAIDDPATVDAIEFYGVDLDALQDEFAAIAPKPPAAFDRRLYAAALGHAELMIGEDDDDPDCGEAEQPPCQLERVGPAGFFFVSGGLRGNAFGFGLSPLFTHASWNVDWGPFFNPVVPPGMFPGRVHRKGVMSDPDEVADEVLTNVGVAAVSTEGRDTDLGPVVYVANYANANTAVADHHDRFVVGTVWQDLDADGAYDPDEGRGGVTVTATPGALFATTAPGGGYAIPIAAPGAVEVAFEGGGVPSFAASVEVAGESVLVDYALPEPGALASALAALLALGGVRRAR
ncbi:MAG: hypothetical protein DCC71_20930 [Proteobacteria bacterium]|nr:MAG: hypothetical protein DCC71_20930 [Pseudomonadota bacterium]